MSTRILEVSDLRCSSTEDKNYIISDKASEAFQGIRPGDVLKVVDVGSGKTLTTGIMCTSTRSVPCGDCLFNLSIMPFIVGACDHVPCHGINMIPVRLENILEEI